MDPTWMGKGIGPTGREGGMDPTWVGEEWIQRGRGRDPAGWERGRDPTWVGVDPIGWERGNGSNVGGRGIDPTRVGEGNGSNGAWECGVGSKLMVDSVFRRAGGRERREGPSVGEERREGAEGGSKCPFGSAVEVGWVGSG